MSKKTIVADDVIDRLSQVLDCKNDTELSKRLKVGRTTISSWRSRQSVPYSECVDVALSEGFFLDYLILGRESPLGNGAIEEGRATYNVLNESDLKVVTQRVLEIAGTREKHPDPMQLGRLRDLAFSARLTDDQIVTIFELLESASEIYND